MEKLLLHRIPVNVPSEELARVIRGDFTIELKVDYVLFNLYAICRYALRLIFYDNFHVIYIVDNFDI